MPSITIGNYTTYKGTPNDVMEDFVNNWDKAFGIKHCEEIANEIRG